MLHLPSKDWTSGVFDAWNQLQFMGGNNSSKTDRWDVLKSLVLSLGHVVPAYFFLLKDV